MIAWVEPDMRADLQASQKGGSGKPLRSVVRDVSGHDRDPPSRRVSHSDRGGVVRVRRR